VNEHLPTLTLITPPEDPPTACTERDYILEQVIGTGGFGKVHRATHLPTGEIRAVKIVPHRSERAQARLDREQALLRALNHPNIVHVQETFTVGAATWIVMDLVEGEPFPGEPVSGWDELAPRFDALLRALEFVHEQGVVHRDIKPSNVLVNGDHPVVLDFGVSWRDSEESITRTRESLGTPRYASGEQLAGGVPSPAWDLHSACVMAVEALTRKPWRPGGTIGDLDLTIPDDRPILRQLLDIVNGRSLPSTVTELRHRLRLSDAVQRRRRLRYPGQKWLFTSIFATLKEQRPVRLRPLPAEDHERFFRELNRQLRVRQERVVPVQELRPLLLEILEARHLGLEDLQTRVEAKLDGGVCVVPPHAPLRETEWALLRAMSRSALVLADPEGVPIPRWTVADLETLFLPVRALSLGHQAAKDLHRATQGLPSAVEREIGAWVRSGRVRQVGDRLWSDPNAYRVRPLAIYSPISRPLPVSLRHGVVRLILDALCFAPNGMSSSQIARGTDQPLALVEAFCQRLVDQQFISEEGRTFRCIAGGNAFRLTHPKRQGIANILARESSDAATRFDAALKANRFRLAMAIWETWSLPEEARASALMLVLRAQPQLLERSESATLSRWAAAALSSMSPKILREFHRIADKPAVHPGVLHAVRAGELMSGHSIREAAAEAQKAVDLLPEGTALFAHCQRMLWRMVLMGAPGEIARPAFRDLDENFYNELVRLNHCYRSRKPEEFLEGAVAIPVERLPHAVQMCWRDVRVEAWAVTSEDGRKGLKLVRDARALGGLVARAEVKLLNFEAYAARLAKVEPPTLGNIALADMYSVGTEPNGTSRLINAMFQPAGSSAHAVLKWERTQGYCGEYAVYRQVMLRDFEQRGYTRSFAHYYANR